MHEYSTNDAEMPNGDPSLLALCIIWVLYVGFVFMTKTAYYVTGLDIEIG